MRDHAESDSWIYSCMVSPLWNTLFACVRLSPAPAVSSRARSRSCSCLRPDMAPCVPLLVSAPSLGAQRSVPALDYYAWRASLMITPFCTRRSQVAQRHGPTIQLVLIDAFYASRAPFPIRASRLPNSTQDRGNGGHGKGRVKSSRNERTLTYCRQAPKTSL
ncbi:hypothetical protein C8R45DRAFT_995200 [Mycena sanguinolenta]|nr:hypothetical protein C8R45DRAFT_995200 [Mycena sanguinolenta]